MPKNEAVAKQLARFELVDWLYDGLGGKVIKWTMEHGGQSDDPAAQAFLLAGDGAFAERADDNTCYTPRRFAEWLETFADRYEKEHRPIRLPFKRATVTLEDGEAHSPTLDAARKDEKPVLLYVSRAPSKVGPPGSAAQVEAAREFARGTLGTPQVAKAVEGWTLLRIDLSRAADRTLAKSLGVTQAPRLIAFVPGEEKHRLLSTAMTGPELAGFLDAKKGTER